jgi:hypothetical protein
MASPAKGAVAVIHGEGLSKMRIVAMAGDAGDLPLVESDFGGEAALRKQALVPSGKFGIGGADDMAAASLVLLSDETVSDMHGIRAVMAVQTSC